MQYDSTRSVAVDANMSRGSGVELPPLSRTDTYTVAAVAAELRTHAAELYDSDPVIATHVMEMADAIDGGTGAGAHHGCPDPSLPTAQCKGCWVVLSTEAPDFPSVFSSRAYGDE